MDRGIRAGRDGARFAKSLKRRFVALRRRTDAHGPAREEWIDNDL